MQRPLGVATKVTILIVLGVIFGATMIALSIRSHRAPSSWDSSWGADKKMEKSFSVQPGGRLWIDSEAGDISVSGTDSQEVVVRVLARGSEDQLQKYRVDMSQEGNSIRVEGRMDRGHFRLWGNYSLDVRYEVRVPKNFNLELSTAGGDIAIDDVKGKIKGSTSGGNLDLSSLDGEIRLTTSGGNVEIKSSAGEFYLVTSGGNMYAESVTGRMSLETSGGNIEIRNSDGKLNASTSGGDIRVTLKDNKGIDLSTSGGNLTLHLPKTISADVNAVTTGGDVSCDFAFTGKLKDGRLKGKINGGGSAIRLETSGGDIVIDSAD